AGRVADVAGRAGGAVVAGRTDCLAGADAGAAGVEVGRVSADDVPTETSGAAGAATFAVRALRTLAVPYEATETGADASLASLERALAVGVASAQATPNLSGRARARPNRRARAACGRL